MAVEVFDAWLTCIVIAMGYALAGIFGWFKLLHKTQRDRSLRQSISAAEAISILGFSSALLFMIHIERLMIPRLLSIEALATFGVLMTVVGSPFHMLQLGISFTMLPRIRDANTGRRLRTLLKIESCFCFGTGILVGVIAWFIAPIMMDWVFSGKYVLSGGLILSAILCGLVKLLDSFVSTFITALGSSFELRLMGILSWVSFFVCVVGGYIGARWGLSGVIYGVGFGWFFRCIIATSFAVKYLRSR